MFLEMRTSSGLRRFNIDEETIIEKYGVDNAHLAHTIYTYVSLLDDSPLHATCGPKPMTTIRKFLDVLVNDFKPTVLHLAELFDRVMKSTTLYGAGSLTGDFEPEMKGTPIFKEYLHWYRTGDPHMLTFISTFLLFCKKVDYVDTSFYDTAFRGWRENEERLENLILPDLTKVKQVVGFLLGDFRFTNDIGRYGPGSVSEKFKGSAKKSVGFKLTPRLSYAFHESKTFGLSVDRLTVPSMRIDPSPQHFFSRLKFVPKNLKTARTICIEPSAAMYYQQMLATDLVDLFDRRLSIFLNLHDQSRNCDWSLYGSSTGFCDTIDLSSASDLVSVDLVRSIFSRPVLFYLMATRSSTVRFGKESYKVKKFAPMGSALCFPIQCLIFLSVVLLSYYEDRFGEGVDVTDDRMNDLIYGMKIPTDEGYNPSSDYIRPLVYGDDIITDSKVSERVTLMLVSLGFKVNNEKSYFSSCAFRESCGGFHWNGYDITPLRFGGLAQWNGTSISRFEAHCEFCNRALDFGYFGLRKKSLTLMRSLYEFPLSFTNDGLESCTIKVLGVPYNSHLRTAKRTKNIDWQRTLYRCVRPRSVREREDVNHPNHERYGYSRWWDAARRRATGSAGGLGRNAKFARRDSHDSRPEWVWTPLR